VIVSAEDNLRTLFEIESEIENTQRWLARHVIHQDDLDHEMQILTRRLGFLEKELDERHKYDKFETI
jgi:hypothetical protein